MAQSQCHGTDQDQCLSVMVQNVIEIGIAGVCAYRRIFPKEFFEYASMSGGGGGTVPRFDKEALNANFSKHGCLDGGVCSSTLISSLSYSSDSCSSSPTSSLSSSSSLEKTLSKVEHKIESGVEAFSQTSSKVSPMETSFSETQAKTYSISLREGNDLSQTREGIATMKTTGAYDCGRSSTVDTASCTLEEEELYEKKGNFGRDEIYHERLRDEARLLLQWLQDGVGNAMKGGFVTRVVFGICSPPSSPSPEVLSSRSDRRSRKRKRSSSIYCHDRLDESYAFDLIKPQSKSSHFQSDRRSRHILKSDLLKIQCQAENVFRNLRGLASTLPPLEHMSLLWRSDERSQDCSSHLEQSSTLSSIVPPSSRYLTLRVEFTPHKRRGKDEKQPNHNMFQAFQAYDQARVDPEGSLLATIGSNAFTGPLEKNGQAELVPTLLGRVGPDENDLLRSSSNIGLAVRVEAFCPLDEDDCDDEEEPQHQHEWMNSDDDDERTRLYEGKRHKGDGGSVVNGDGSCGAILETHNVCSGDRGCDFSSSRNSSLKQQPNKGTCNGGHPEVPGCEERVLNDSKGSDPDVSPRGSSVSCDIVVLDDDSQSTATPSPEPSSSERGKLRTDGDHGGRQKVILEARRNDITMLRGACTAARDNRDLFSDSDRLARQEEAPTARFPSSSSSSCSLEQQKTSHILPAQTRAFAIPYGLRKRSGHDRKGDRDHHAKAIYLCCTILDHKLDTAANHSCSVLKYKVGFHSCPKLRRKRMTKQWIPSNRVMSAEDLVRNVDKAIQGRMAQIRGPCLEDQYSEGGIVVSRRMIRDVATDVGVRCGIVEASVRAMRYKVEAGSPLGSASDDDDGDDDREEEDNDNDKNDERTHVREAVLVGFPASRRLYSYIVNPITVYF